VSYCYPSTYILQDKNNVIHRDLAARNILLRADNQPVVSDFGFARTAAEDGGKTKSTVGPLRWMPPEALTKGQYSTKSDVWAFGVTVYEILTNGELPYKEYDASINAVTVNTSLHCTFTFFIGCTGWTHFGEGSTI
jgi:serine/threonine protein kinase